MKKTEFLKQYNIFKVSTTLQDIMQTLKHFNDNSNQAVAFGTKKTGRSNPPAWFSEFADKQEKFNEKVETFIVEQKEFNAKQEKFNTMVLDQFKQHNWIK